MADPIRSEQTSVTSDAALLQRFKAGEDDAATALYTRYANRLVNLAERNIADDLSVRVDAEDIVQSVFRTFFRRAADGHYLVPEGDELWKLLLVIALNKVRMAAEHHRRIKRDVRHTKSIDGLDLEKSKNTTEVLRITIDDLLKDLPSSHKQVVHLRIDGCEIAEIATQVNVSRRSVERILQTFRIRLREALESK